MYGNNIYGESFSDGDSINGGGGGSGTDSFIRSPDFTSKMECLNVGQANILINSLPTYSATSANTIITNGTSNVNVANSGAINFTSGGLNVASFATNGAVAFNKGITPIEPLSNFEVLNSAGPTILVLTSVSAQTNIQFARINGSTGARTQVITGNNLGNVGCRGWTGTGVLSNTGATIQFIATENYLTAINNGTKISFSTASNGTGTLTQRMTVDQSGFVGINQINPTSTLHIVGAAGTTMRLVDGQQAVGRVLSCIDAIGNVKWQDFNNIVSAHGYIYNENPIGTSLAVAGFVALNTKYPIAISTTLANSSDFSMPSNGVLRYDNLVTKQFKVSANISFCNDNGVLSTDIRNFYFWIFKNGSVITGASCRGSSIPGAIFCEETVEAYVSLATNDTIQIYVSNESPSIITTAGIGIGSMSLIIS